MPRITPNPDLDHLVELIGTAPEGVGIDALAQQLGTPLHRRTLQRRLALLVAQQRIEMLGDRRTARYRRRSSAAISAHEPEAAWRNAARPDDMLVSAQGAEVRAYVTQPRQRRTPVAYRQSFLEQYQPNHTTYLPHDLCEQLHAMGRSPSAQTPAGTFARDMLNRLLIDLSWASSLLEGNTYSRLDTERLIAFGQAAEGKDALETQMILNHKQAIEYLVLSPDNARVQTDTVIALHAFLSDGLMADPTAVGRVRRRPVEIGGSVYLPLALPQRLEELLGIVVQMAAEIADPFEQAFFLMVHLPYLQPFEDVNKRV
jgi:hypothetical protein